MSKGDVGPKGIAIDKDTNAKRQAVVPQTSRNESSPDVATPVGMTSTSASDLFTKSTGRVVTNESVAANPSVARSSRLPNPISSQSSVASARKNVSLAEMVPLAVDPVNVAEPKERLSADSRMGTSSTSGDLPPQWADQTWLQRMLPPSYSGATTRDPFASVGRSQDTLIPDGQGGYVPVQKQIVFKTLEGQEILIDVPDSKTRWRRRLLFNIVAMLVCFLILALVFWFFVP